MSAAYPWVRVGDSEAIVAEKLGDHLAHRLANIPGTNAVRDEIRALLNQKPIDWSTLLTKWEYLTGEKWWMRDFKVTTSHD